MLTALARKVVVNISLTSTSEACTCTRGSLKQMMGRKRVSSRNRRQPGRRQTFRLGSIFDIEIAPARLLRTNFAI